MKLETRENEKGATKNKNKIVPRFLCERAKSRAMELAACVEGSLSAAHSHHILHHPHPSISLHSTSTPSLSTSPFQSRYVLLHRSPLKTLMLGDRGFRPARCSGGDFELDFARSSLISRGPPGVSRRRSTRLSALLISCVFFDFPRFYIYVFSASHANARNRLASHR